ncbi:hypothetical protein PGT21_000647 [Puccinia graminis f. sp. tritici]|uniref:HAT C-terminal dimerisation domain-containing protein n=1 Tax=Puccinia graminis f. sp. tritici TaxID=56615 RepID=A0A5B0MQ88_PUCGR|nr:hypothetical protein PGT21_000647 [Puccinia graminis f. sp. tritici]
MSNKKDNPQSNKIKAYLKAELFFKEDNLDHKTTPLIKWWRANKTTYQRWQSLPEVAIVVAFSPQLTLSAASCGCERKYL